MSLSVSVLLEIVYQGKRLECAYWVCCPTIAVYKNGLNEKSEKKTTVVFLPWLAEIGRKSLYIHLRQQHS